VRARHQARIVALQALYEIDCANHAPAVVLEQRFVVARLPTAAKAFARHLVSGVLEHQTVLDMFIHRHAPEWPLEQMAYIDRNILRVAIFEFAVDGQTPVKVAINEAMGETNLETVNYLTKFDPETHFSWIPLFVGQWQKTDADYVWELGITHSEHDYLAPSKEFIFPVPYDE